MSMASHLARPTAGEYDQHFAGYIERVPAGDVLQVLQHQIAQTLTLLRPLSEAQGAFAYAPGKWTIKEVIGHIADVERVMAYRALRFARNDPTPLPGFDENAWTPEGRFGARSMPSLMDELASVRAATITLFAGLPDAAWTRAGAVMGHTTTVRALACIIAGHELHHRIGLRERYIEAVPA